MANALRGGFVPDGADYFRLDWLPFAFSGKVHGQWGFEPFDGPVYKFQRSDPSAKWMIPDERYDAVPSPGTTEALPLAFGEQRLRGGDQFSQCQGPSQEDRSGNLPAISLEGKAAAGEGSGRRERAAGEAIRRRRKSRNAAAGVCRCVPSRRASKSTPETRRGYSREPVWIRWACWKPRECAGLETPTPKE